MGGTDDACGLHVTLDKRFQRANFEVSVDCPSIAVYAFGQREMQFGRFVIECLIVMGEAVSVAVDAVDVVSSDLPEPS